MTVRADSEFCLLFFPASCGDFPNFDLLVTLEWFHISFGALAAERLRHVHQHQCWLTSGRGWETFNNVSRTLPSFQRGTQHVRECSTPVVPSASEPARTVELM